METNVQKLVNRFTGELEFPQFVVKSFPVKEGTIYKMVFDLAHLPQPKYEKATLFVKPEEYLIGVDFTVPRPYMDLMDFNKIEVRICYRMYKLRNLLNDWTLKRMKKLLENNSKEDFKKEYIERNEMENKELEVQFGDLVKVMGKILNEQSKNFEHTIEIVYDSSVNSLLDDIDNIKREIELKHNQIYGLENKIHSIISLQIGALEDFEG